MGGITEMQNAIEANIAFFFPNKTLVREGMILITLIMLTSICSTVGHAIAGECIVLLRPT